MASPLTNTASVSAQLEAATGAEIELFERASKTWDLIKGAKKVNVSSRAMRVAFDIAPPGNFSVVDLDGGDLGRGGGSQYVHGTLSPIDFALTLEVTKKAEISSNSDEKALVDVVQKDIKAAPKEFAWNFDCLMQSAGTGQLSAMSSGAGTTTWTLGGNFKTALLHRGQQVENYSAAFAAKRVGVSTILAVNYAAGTVTVDAAPVGHANTDLIVVKGMTGATPVNLFGIPYYNNTATTGTILTLTRSLYPELQAQGIDAGGALLTPQYVRGALNRLRLRRDDESLETGMVAHMSPVQVDAYEQNATAVMHIDKTSSAKEDFDLFFKPNNINGVPIKTTPHADPTRIDFINRKRWFRAVSAEIGFYTDPGEGGKAYPIYAASGARAAATGWALFASMQIGNTDPGSGAVVSNLAKPSSYV